MKIQFESTTACNARAVMCCLDYDGKQVIGDANKQTLSELWFVAKPLRKRHLNLDFNMEPCKECNQNII